METLARRWREDADAASREPGDLLYQQGYADALTRCAQALRALEEQW
jgi:hypothetical protein